MRQLIELRTAQTNQRRLVEDADVLASFTAVLSTINQQIRSLEAKVIALIDADPLWIALDAAFREIKGVADRTIARLIAHVPEIGTLSARQLPNSAAWHRSRATAASGRCAADARRCAPSFI